MSRTPSPNTNPRRRRPGEGSAAHWALLSTLSAWDSIGAGSRRSGTPVAGGGSLLFRNQGGEGVLGALASIAEGNGVHRRPAVGMQRLVEHPRGIGVKGEEK